MKAESSLAVPASHLVCDTCGRMPEPSRARLTAANVLAILPIELLVHAVVVNTPLPYLLKVAVLALTATALVVWITEPSVRRVLTRWLHAPEIERRTRLSTASALWSVKVRLDDRPGALRALTGSLRRVQANILTIDSHVVPHGVVDELVIETDADVTEDDIASALREGHGRQVHVQRTTPVALADGQTRALTLSARVAADPDDLAEAVAELLSARVLADPHVHARPAGEGELLKIPGQGGTPLHFIRPGDPFTPAESARAHRLAELAEAVTLGRLSPLLRSE